MKRLSALVCAAVLLGGANWVWGQEGLFDKLDANKDGVVTAEEIEGDEQKALFERALRRGDKDGDKKLSKEEFLAATQPREGDEPRPDRPREGQPRGDRPREGQPREGQPREGQPRRIDGVPQPPRPDAARYFEETFKKWDANSDGKLTEDEVPENARARFKQLLERLDDDGDKAITKEQAPRVVMMLAQPGGPPEGFRPDVQMAERLFREWDGNKDGRLSADEVPAERRDQFRRLTERLDVVDEKGLTPDQFARVAMGMMVAGPPGLAPGGFPGAMPMAVLRVLDGDSDGELSKEEIEDAAASLAKLDKNEDGKLTRDELMPGFGGGFPGGPFPGRPGEGRRPEGDRPDQPRREGRPDDRPREGGPGGEQIRARLKELDTNADGKLSKDEAQGRFKENFDAIDANSDGQLDADEVLSRFQGRRPEGDRPDRRRPEGDRPDGRRPPAEGEEKPKDEKPREE